MRLLDWVRLPSMWIEDGGLAEFKWKAHGNSGANGVAALMTLMVIAHQADGDTGEASLTYDRLCEISGLSRSKLSSGLSMLADTGLIERNSSGRSSYKLLRYDLSERWCKMPARRLYTRSGDRIPFFHEFSLRKPTELNALKLYLLFAARRDGSRNVAQISYDKISEYTDMDRNRIRSAISLLAAFGLVHVEQLPSTRSQYGVSNGYRLAFLDANINMGTTHRGKDEHDFDQDVFVDVINRATDRSSA